MGAAARMMVVVSGRAFIPIVMGIIRRGRAMMILLAAALGSVTANGETSRIGAEGAGIQPGHCAKNHQPCANQSHKLRGDSVRFTANSRKNPTLGSDRRSCISGMTRSFHDDCEIPPPLRKCSGQSDGPRLHLYAGRKCRQALHDEAGRWAGEDHLVRSTEPAVGGRDRPTTRSPL